MSSFMAGFFYLLSVISFCYLFHQVSKMMTDHNYRMTILRNNHQRDMTLLQNDHQQEIERIAAARQPQLNIPLMRVTVRFVRHSELPDQKEIER